MHTHILRDAEGNEAGTLVLNPGGVATITTHIEGVGRVSVWVPSDALVAACAPAPPEPEWRWAHVVRHSNPFHAKVQVVDGFPVHDGVSSYRMRTPIQGKTLLGLSATVVAPVVFLVPAWKARQLDDVLQGALEARS